MLGSITVIEYIPTAFDLRTFELEIRQLICDNPVKFFFNKNFAASTWTLLVVLFPPSQAFTAEQALTSIALDWILYNTKANFTDKVIEHSLGLN
jgi:hypothetical protein